jgi:Flp pilus assembly pilin Flp
MKVSDKASNPVLGYSRFIKRGSESGATMVEYAMITVVIVLVFVVAGNVIQNAGERAGNSSAGIAKETSIPCIKWAGGSITANAEDATCIESTGCLSDRTDTSICYCCIP